MAEEIVKVIKWTPRALESYESIINYLLQEWTEREAEQFSLRVSSFLTKLKKHPEMCRPSIKRRHVRVGLVDKHTQLIYHFKPKKRQIEILLFWSMKQDRTN